MCSGITPITSPPAPRRRRPPRPSGRRSRRRRRDRCPRQARPRPARRGRDVGRLGARVGAAEHAHPLHVVDVLSHGRPWTGSSGPSPTTRPLRYAPGAMGDLAAAAARRSTWRRRWSPPARGAWAAGGGPDIHQVLAYDLAHAAAAAGRWLGSCSTTGPLGDVEARLTCAFAADAVHDLGGSKVLGPGSLWGVAGDSPSPRAPTSSSSAHRDPAFLASLAATSTGPRHLDPDFEMVQDTFRRFAERARSSRPPSTSTGPTPTYPGGHHQRPGRDGGLRPQRPRGVRRMGASGGESDYLGMVVATEELFAGLPSASAGRSSPARRS